MTSNPSQIRTNVQVPLPSKIIGTPPIAIQKTSGAWNIGLNPNSVPLINPPPIGSFILGYNPNPPTPSWFKTIIQSGITTYRTIANDTANNTPFPNRPIQPEFFLPPGKYLIHGNFPCVGGSGVSGVAIGLELISGTMTSFTTTGYAVNASSGISHLTLTTGVSSGTITGAAAQLGGALQLVFDIEMELSVGGIVLMAWGQASAQSNTSQLLAGGTFAIHSIAN
jgi:hypothetical protein